MKTFRIKLGDLKSFIREIYGADGMPGHSAAPGESTGRTPMAETDAGPSWPHSWPKPKNSELLKAHRAVMEYLGPEQTTELVNGKYALDPHVDGTVAVRLEDGGASAGTNMDFVVYNCNGNCSADDVEEVAFTSWPPRVNRAHR